MNALASFVLPLLLSGGPELQVDNVRPTYGYLGPTRTKQGILPGDVAHFAFDLKNVKLDDKGNASYSIAVEVLDPTGKVFYHQPPYNSVARCFLGGNTLPCAAHLEVPAISKPGEYTLKVILKDRLANKEIVLKRTGKVLEPTFGIVHVGTFADREGRVPVGPVGTVGGNLYIGFGAIGFQRDKKTGQPDVAVSLKIIDDQGKATQSQAQSGRVNADVPADLHVVPMQFGITLNRPGRFTVELTATDNLANKSETVSFPIRVVPVE